MLALLIGLPSSSFSQILDDSTILVYGPSTLNVILEENLKSNDKRLVFIDTLVGKLDQFTAYGRSDYKCTLQWRHKTAPNNFQGRGCDTSGLGELNAVGFSAVRPLMETS